MFTESSMTEPVTSVLADEPRTTIPPFDLTCVRNARELAETLLSWQETLLVAAARLLVRSTASVTMAFP